MGLKDLFSFNFFDPSSSQSDAPGESSYFDDFVSNNFPEFDSSTFVRDYPQLGPPYYGFSTTSNIQNVQNCLDVDNDGYSEDFESVGAYFAEEDIAEENAQPVSPRSTCRDENFERNTKTRNCHPLEMESTSECTFVSNFDGTVTNLNICSFPEKGIIQKDALPGLAFTSHGDENVEPHNHKMKYKRSRSKYPSKKKITLGNLSTLDSDIAITSENISNLPQKGMIKEDDLPDSALLMHGATRTTFSTGGQNTRLKSQGTQVKLSVKDITVPGFCVEIPENATLSDLERVIMEKATALVIGGLGVLVQGKKVRDRNKMLLETDIFQESRLDVIVEPKPAQAPVCLYPHRYSPTPATLHHGTCVTSTDPLGFNLGNDIHGGHELVESQANTFRGESTTTSRELIVLPTMDLEPQCVGPMPQKSNSSKHVKRRKSDFFSVSEVEALVQEVEKVGTGRWQKIKDQAFGNASNRTHMDLKDKWRSLVKAAKRPANKRRGAVLSQELLNRVLAIEAHNSQQQAMQYQDVFN